MDNNKSKETTSKEFTNDRVGFYKDYDIRWLKGVKDEHPKGYLVNEYEKKHGEVK